MLLGGTMNQSDIQEIIDRAVKIATREAMNGHPVEQVLWIPPQTATQDHYGAFAVKHALLSSPSQLPPWDI